MSWRQSYPGDGCLSGAAWGSACWGLLLAAALSAMALSSWAAKKTSRCSEGTNSWKTNELTMRAKQISSALSWAEWRQHVGLPAKDIASCPASDCQRLVFPTRFLCPQWEKPSPAALQTHYKKGSVHQPSKALAASTRWAQSSGPSAPASGRGMRAGSCCCCFSWSLSEPSWPDRSPKEQEEKSQDAELWQRRREGAYWSHWTATLFQVITRAL